MNLACISNNHEVAFYIKAQRSYDGRSSFLSYIQPFPRCFDPTASYQRPLGIAKTFCMRTKLTEEVHIAL